MNKSKNNTKPKFKPVSKMAFYFIEILIIAYVISLILRGLKYMTPSDIKKRCGSKPSSSQISGSAYVSTNNDNNLPSLYDPRSSDEQIMDTVKDQGECASCVSHACASGLAISYQKQNPNDRNYGRLNLSPQYILSCKTQDENNVSNPCAVTYINTTLDNMQIEKGIPLNDDCPYTYETGHTKGSNAKCKVVAPPSLQTQKIIKIVCLIVITLISFCILFVITNFKNKTLPLTFLTILFCIIGSLLPSFLKYRSTKAIELLFYLFIGLIFVLGSSANYNLIQNRKMNIVQLLLAFLIAGFSEIFYRDIFKLQTLLNKSIQNFDIFEYFIRKISKKCHKSDINVCKKTYSPIYKLKKWEQLKLNQIKNAILEYGHVINGSNIGGGHAIVLVGWDDNQIDNKVWLYKNSWGENSGDDGYDYISEEDLYCDKKLELYVITEVEKVS